MCPKKPSAGCPAPTRCPVYGSASVRVHAAAGVVEEPGGVNTAAYIEEAKE